ncbi:interleukin-1 receptor accessory protein-like isoform X2 [Narcine bancroftii]|uniref:interleukin-1 receptor accessory protein-like isoform X2 n=1 Tax=Narcine bancroftii TaxID=1343680 RepID=UPI0038311C20
MAANVIKEHNHPGHNFSLLPSGRRMAHIFLVLLLGLLFGTGTSEARDQSGGCIGWGVDNGSVVKAHDGEPLRVRCPLFPMYTEWSYRLANGSGLTLLWYKSTWGEEQEMPMNFHQEKNRVSAEQEWLCFWPVFTNDSGNYTCMLRNTSGCFKASVSLLIIHKGPGKCFSSEELVFPLELPVGDTIFQMCPDTSNFSTALVNSSTAWYMKCSRVGKKITVSEIGGQLRFGVVREYHKGNYTCVVTVSRGNQTFNLTRTLHVTIIASQREQKRPVLVQPKTNVEVQVEFGQVVNLNCTAFFHYIRESPTRIWWSVDGRRAQEFAPAIQVFQSEELLTLKDKRMISTMRIRAVTAADLRRNYTCFAQNSKGESSAQVTLVRKAPSYAVELGSGLGVVLLIVVSSVVVYHVWWIEIVLFYRLHFGTDETIGDEKEYDAYLSYARNAEEEEFVLMTLQSVLENEYGYKVCIYDRDSLPGGVITDETLSCIWKSRRLLVLLSPNYLAGGTQALLELKAGTEQMARTGQIRVILVEFLPVGRGKQVAELKRLKAVMSTIKWEGERSRDLTSKFWKKLQVSLPSRGHAQSSRTRSRRLHYEGLAPSNRVSGSQSVSDTHGVGPGSVAGGPSHDH